MEHSKHTNNIILVGMPGVGKSTVGVRLAKVSNRDFVDTDVVIQSREDRSLREIIDEDGRELFCVLEERHVLSLSFDHAVIATGGSVVYSQPAMEYLSARGPVIHLDAPLKLIQQRVKSIGERGVVIMPGQTLENLYHERQPLYREWADITVDTEGRDQEEVLSCIVRSIKEHESGRWAIEEKNR